MKALALISAALLIGGCATHPSNVEPSGSEYSYTFNSCKENYQDVNTAYDKYINLYDKQEFANFGDIFLVFMIGLPLMPDHEDELSEALNEYNVTLASYKNNCEKLK